MRFSKGGNQCLADREVRSLSSSQRIASRRGKSQDCGAWSVRCALEPVRIVRRFGRVGAWARRMSISQMVTFWPDVDLESYINLECV